MKIRFPPGPLLLGKLLACKLRVGGLTVGVLLLATLLPGTSLLAQSVQPVIMEYKGSADGKVTLINNTIQRMVVVLEPKSFSISPNGRGVYRHLDPGINVQMSRTSVLLEPKQTYYVFYKATSDILPAWFTIYSTFTAAQHGKGLDVRILLPHTVYLYQKEPILEADVHIVDAVFSPQTRKVVCDLENSGPALARIQEVQAMGYRASQNAAGFPLLPALKRRVEIDWPEKNPPNWITFRFDHFTMRHQVVTEDALKQESPVEVIGREPSP